MNDGAVIYSGGSALHSHPFAAAFPHADPHTLAGVRRVRGM